MSNIAVSFLWICLGLGITIGSSVLTSEPVISNQFVISFTDNLLVEGGFCSRLDRFYRQLLAKPAPTNPCVLVGAAAPVNPRFKYHLKSF
jgi:hypothetical protein